MSWLTGEWSATYLVYHTDDPWHLHCEQLPGVYRLIALQEGGSTTKPAFINRVCGQDETGTLYIGGATILTRRVGQLVMQHRDDYKTKHHKAFPDVMTEMYKSRQLGVCWSYVDRDPFVVEWELARAYREQFGEFPPLDG